MMEIILNQFSSDTFTISNRTLTGVGFNCPDSFLIFWRKLSGTNTHRVYKLGNKYLEPFLSTTDSFSVSAKNLNPSLHYAVAPVIGSREGMKSYTFDYTTQGVECYVRSFLVSLVNNTTELFLSLGTLYNINKIVLEKFDGTNFISTQELTAINTLQYNFKDAALKKGLNIYRISIELAGGRVIYSSAETVYYFSEKEYIIYPNPISQNQPINILVDDPFPTVTLRVMNTNGQLFLTQKINDLVTTIPSGKLSKGIYLFRFIKENEKDILMKVVVQ